MSTVMLPGPRRPQTAKKFKSLEELAEVIARLKQRGKRVVLCHGVFDLLHIGHIRHFEQARQHGDVLVVTLTQDQFVNKGHHRPIFPEQLRAEAIAALDVVSYVAINRWPSAEETLRLVQPSIYCKGSEYRTVQGDIRDALLREIAAVESVGGCVEYTEDVIFSSSQLINTHLSIFPPETEAWLKSFRKKYSSDDVIRYLEAASHVKALVIGEAIIDEYVFCDGLGKSTKDPILAFRYNATERYLGGSLAVANHLAGFCGEVGLLTLLGDVERDEPLVRAGLRPNVQPHFITQRGAPSIHKRRFVDTHTAARMFELYVMGDEPLNRENTQEVERSLQTLLQAYDVVVVADYGHGMLTTPSVRAICEGARFLSVNTQANAGNRGFNTISKSPRADYVCLAGHEIALETRMRDANWRDLVLEVTKRIDCQAFTVTLGKYGSLHYGVDGGFTDVPALATRVTDRVGAGDAVLAATSLLVAQHAPWDIVGFVGNLAGAEMVAELGNRIAIDKAALTRHVASLMK